jgi:type VI secretion system secreted protein VgrG
LTAGSDDEILGSPCNVWWKVVSSATIGSGTTFIGNIMALTSISLGTGATLNGRALAQTGAVTLDNNTFTGATCLTTPAFGSGSVTPRLPNTGTGPQQNATSLWAYGISAVVIIALLSFVAVRKKRIS